MALWSMHIDLNVNLLIHNVNLKTSFPSPYLLITSDECSFSSIGLLLYLEVKNRNCNKCLKNGPLFTTGGATERKSDIMVWIIHTLDMRIKYGHVKTLRKCPPSPKPNLFNFCFYFGDIGNFTEA